MGDRTLTRRALVGAAGAALAAGIPASAPAEAATPASDLDAEWSALLDRFNAALAAWEATDAPLAEAVARARAAYPPRPDALLWREGDFPRTSYGLALSTSAGDVDGVERREYRERAADWLRDRPAATWFRTLSPPLGSECEARRLEILAAWDGWQAERVAVEDRVGLTAAAEAEEAAGDAYLAADEAVAAYQPRTVAGLALKAAWVAERLSTSEGARASDLGEVFARQVAAFGGAAS